MLRGFSSGLKNKRHIQCQIILLLLWWKLNPQRRVAPLREKVASKLILYSSVLLTNPGATRTFCGSTVDAFGNTTKGWTYRKLSISIHQNLLVWNGQEDLLSVISCSSFWKIKVPTLRQTWSLKGSHQAAKYWRGQCFTSSLPFVGRSIVNIDAGK